MGNGSTKFFDLHSAFSIPTDRKSHDAAINWASSYGIQEYERMDVDNNPISNARVISLEARGEGGRAIRTMIEVGGKMLIVDLREDEFYPTLLENGLLAGGLLHGSFRWIVNSGNHTTLVREGGEIREDSILQTAIRSVKPTKVKDLEFGKSYRTLGGSRFTYLGRNRCPEMHSKCLHLLP